MAEVMCERCNGDGAIERLATPEEVDAGCELGIAYDPCPDHKHGAYTAPVVHKPAGFDDDDRPFDCEVDGEPWPCEVASDVAADPLALVAKIGAPLNDDETREEITTSGQDMPRCDLHGTALERVVLDLPTSEAARRVHGQRVIVAWRCPICELEVQG